MLDFSLSDEQKALVETARRFTREHIIPIAAECDREARFPQEIFHTAHELGLVNATVPPEYGATFVALAQSMQYLSMIVAPLLGTWLAEYIGLDGALWLSAALRLVGFLLFLRPDRK